jgi:peptide deformylase
MLLDIVIYGDEILTKKAEPVKDIDDIIRKLGADMLETLAGRGVGLAAPQIGQSLRMFVTDVEGDKHRIFINPEILLTSQEQVTFEEGCLSLPLLYVDVIRPETIKIQAWNEKGRPFTLEVGGFLARVIQHEYDHLDGILFLDRLKSGKRDRALRQYDRLSKA